MALTDEEEAEITRAVDSLETAMDALSRQVALVEQAVRERFGDDD